jgi:glycosyltransferase involved in cell wall biosynthesis
MASVADAPASDRRPPSACLAQWRETMAERQMAALPDGSVTVSCSAAPGKGGLGRHLDELVAAVERGGRQSFRISGSDRAQGLHPPGSALAGIAPLRLAGPLARTALPLPQGIRALAHSVDFDRDAAARLPPAQHLVAFNGQALIQLRAARHAGYRTLGLVSANSHMRNVIRQHERARRRYPLEGSWTRWLLPRNLKEYEQADRIYFASGYIRDSFLEQGFSDQRMVDFPLMPHPRFDSARAGGESDAFEVVYSGSLAVHKGVPLLVEAFRRLDFADMRLKLVGGWGTRGMRRFVESACAEDPRITAGPGDPLDHLRTASLCVHPAYEDGFGYAPAEALASGVPVIVSEDTGMKELISSHRAGLILPTGDLDALTQALEAAYRAELFGA